jgi:hypothetical protein
MEKEIWKEVPDYEHYEVSNLGTIRRWNVSRTKNKIITPTTWSNAPYKMWTVSKNGKYTKMYLHRCIATLFVNNDKPLENTHVCFLDGNIENTVASNLYWSNQKDRMTRRSKEGGYQGSKTPHAKLSKIDVITIRWMDHHKTMSHREMAEYFGVHRWTIYACVKRITWKHIK